MSPSVLFINIINLYSAMVYMFYSVISILMPIFIVCRTLFIVSGSRFHSWAPPLNKIFIVHCSSAPLWSLTQVTLLCDPNVARDHFVVKSLLRSSCIDKGIMSIVCYVQQWGRKFFSANVYECICFCMFNVYFTANSRILRRKFF